MDSELSLSLFACPSPQGQAFAERVRALAAGLGYRVSVPAEPTQAEFSLACLRDRAVVADASLEQGCERPYAAFTEQAKVLDHVLVVSRTYLPINFFGLRRGGAPAYPYPLAHPDGSRPATAWSEDGILAWLREQLCELGRGDAGPRLDVRDVSEVQARQAEVREMMEWSLDRAKARRQTGPRVFLIYRGAHHQAVRELAARIARGDFHPGQPPPSVVVLSPGELSYDRELLSEMRRWQVLGLLDDHLRDSTEAWVFDTPDYLGSWWTVGEMVLAAYVRPDAGGGLVVRVFDPRTGRVHDDAGRFTVRLAEEQRQRMARLLSHTRPDGMAPESLGLYRFLRLLDRVRLATPLMRRAAQNAERAGYPDQLKEALPGTAAEKEEIFGAMRQMWADPRALRAYVNDPVFSREFWEYLSFERGEGALDGRRIDPAQFLDFSARLARALPPRRVIRTARRGKAIDLGDGVRVRVREAAPRFLWRPTRLGSLTGGLESIPTFVSE